MIGANNLTDVSSAATSYDNIKQQGTLTFTGAWESATTTEINTGTDVTRTITPAGLSGSQLQTDVTTNNSKVTNVTTNLSEGTTTNTTVDVNSSDGTNATLVAASTTRAGVMTKAKFDEVVVNNAKVTNATHTIDVTGSGALTINKVAITNKTSITAAATDEILISDASDGGNLKRVTAQSIADLSAGDSSFVSIEVDTIHPFNNTAVYFSDTTIFQEHVVIGSAATRSITSRVVISGQNISGSNNILVLEDGSSNEKVTFQNDGRVGIGTTGPVDGFLHVVADLLGTSLVRIHNTNNSTGNGLLIITNNTSSVDRILSLTSSSVSRMVVLNSGDVAIGNGFVTPTAKFHIRGINAASTSDALAVDDNVGTQLLIVENAGDVGIGIADPTQKLHVNGNTIIENILANSTQLEVLGSGVTTFVTTGSKMKITGDAGANTIATITGGIDGQTLTLTFVDALVTITDNNTSSTNTINLGSAFTSTENDILVLEFDGASWREASRSVN